MLWRVISIAAAPGVGSASQLMDEMRRLCDVGKATAADAMTDTGGASVAGPDREGSASHVASSVSVMTSVRGQVVETVTATVVSVSGAAAAAADTTAQAASKAALATLYAASRAAVSTREAVASLGRQLANTDRIAELRADADVLAGFHGSREWRDQMRALFAVGIALAAADGEITESERQDIEDYVGGAGYSALPVGIRADVQGWLEAPPSIEEAFGLAAQGGDKSMALVDNVMEVITRSDDLEHPAEAAFRKRWQELRQGLAP
ncbi:hypothetical protein [Lysobacter sp. HA18]